MNKKVIIITSLVSILLIGGSVGLITKLANSQQIEAVQGVSVEIPETSFNWGEIGMKNGTVTRDFEITNTGDQVLKLFNVTTSCMCTTAQFEGDSEVFGMHTKSSSVKEIKPGDSAKLKVIFDPAFHGPSGIGPITRQVSIQTNDPDHGEIDFTLTATVNNN